MYAFAVTRRRSIVPAVLAAMAVFLCGCAADRFGQGGRPGSDCRGGAILYCAVDLHLDVETCHCVWRGDLRDRLRHLGRR